MSNLDFKIKIVDDLFYRKEKEDTFTIFSIETGLKFLENISAEIFDLIVKGYSPVDIFGQLLKTYPEIPKEQLYNDFVSLLSSLKENSIIDYKGELSMNKSYLGICNETDYKLVEKFFLKNYGKYNDDDPKLISMINKRYYNAMNLRSVSLYAKELYFIKKIDEDVKGVISVGGFDQNIQTVSITNVIAEKNDIEILKEIFEYLEKYFIKLGVRKFKLTLILNTPHRGIIKLIESFGFVQEALLECEFKTKDVIIYKKILEGEKHL